MASELYKALTLASEAVKKGEAGVNAIKAIVNAHLSEFPTFILDYIEVLDHTNLDRPTTLLPAHTYQLLVAATLGGTRLIDNITLPTR